MKDFLEYSKRNYILLCLALGCLYITPLVISNFYYIDDVSRSVGGYARWIDNGRPLAQYLILAMGFSNVIDIAPLPLILSVIVLVTSGYYLCYSIGVEGKYPAVVIALAILCSPFYIQNLSYRYDALTMGISLSCALLAASISYRFNIKIGFPTATILVAILLCFYQPSVNAFISVVCFLFILKLNEKSAMNAIIYAAANVLSLIAGMLIYKLFVAEVFVNGGYSVEHSDILPIALYSIPLINKNLDSFLVVFKSTLSGSFGRLFYFMFFISTALTMFTVAKSKGYSLALAGVSALLSLVAILVMVFSIVGTMIFLKQPVFYPRVFIGFTGVMLLISYSSTKIFKGFSSIIPSIFFLAIFVQMFAYGNALSSQSEKEKFMFTAMADDIIKSRVKIESIRFNGTTSLAPTSYLSSKSFGIITHIVPSYIRTDWMFGAFYFGRLGVDVTYDSKIDVNGELKKGCSKPHEKSSLYDSVVFENTMIFDFNRCK
ncbi:glucosyltransferase domain-containing protein [Erwinia sp. E_sp_B04_7]|uniref:glucosyltransferase domain-containing protein n=1 Tax=unclassified Erwinia TaxID=2622719 RepID=UPI0030CB8243